MKKKAEILAIILIVIMFAVAGYAGVDLTTKTVSIGFGESNSG